MGIKWTIICLVMHMLVLSDGVKIDIDRVSEGAGFHRNLKTTIKLNGITGDVSSCYVVLVESLPVGMYVDLYQAKLLERFDGPKLYSPIDIDIERPEYLSRPHKLYVFPVQTKHESDSISVSVEMPIHLRYHATSQDVDYKQVTLPSPTVMYRCPDMDTTNSKHFQEARCDSSNERICVWKILPIEDAHELEFEVPVGSQRHVGIVIALTASATILGTLCVIFTIVTVEEDKQKTH